MGSRMPVRQHQCRQRPVPAENPNYNDPGRDALDMKGRRQRVTGPITTMKLIIIVQYNCGNLNYRAICPLFNSLDLEEHQIIIIQKPAFNK